ncbi:primary-amine oxidase [Pseudonocardia spinosispora]|uniref:primary-amine oxidase n=1 Tax=Pseudonocardia spinosispora TaxID=103441 RepID=UPI00041C48F8|nr:primary-amine oxidase [Pseudonocardia spinosispora]
MTAHPLDPLSEAEFRQVRDILRREKNVVRPAWRIASVELHEPEKAVAREFRSGDQIVREARVVAWQTDVGTAWVGLLSLTKDAVLSWTSVPGKQPNATVDEWHDCDVAMRAHPEVIAVLGGRGVTDMDLVLVDVWTYGAHLIPEQYSGRRIGWCDVWLRAAHDANPYAHPVSGLKLVVDLNTMELLEIEDTPGAGFPPVQGEYVPKHVPDQVLRTDRRPLEITQPDGVSFTLDGHQLSWQRWQLRVGFTYREGLVLHAVSYDGRPVAHRLSFAEMVVPYRDPSPDHVRRTAYDIGEWGLGFMTTSLELGCDCLGEITYLDAVLHDSAGEPQVIRNAVCIHEEDNAVLWKHVDERAGAEVRRMRRLVVSAHVTVANYEYLVYWRFHEDGSIECEVRATGIMVTTPFSGEQPPPYGTVVDHQTYAPIHQHFIVARLDMEVDGPDNTVVMSETAQPPIGPDNPHGLALTQRSVPLRTEAEGRQDYNWSTQRAWKITNPGKRNKVGAPVAYKLVPGAAVPAMLDPESPVLKRAQVLRHTLWVTPFDRDERWPCGEFVNQSGTDEGLPVWTEADRSIENTDVVLWYVFGIHHVPRVEDWPIMPADTVSFWLKPTGFFDHNPSLDVAPSQPRCH